MNRVDLSNLAFLIRSFVAKPTWETMELADKYMESTDSGFLCAKETLRQMLRDMGWYGNLEEVAKNWREMESYSKEPNQMKISIANSILFVIESDRS